jgi:hypothetical protein
MLTEYIVNQARLARGRKKEEGSTKGGKQGKKEE